MRRTVSVVAIMALACSLASRGTGILDNGTIHLQDINGDGTIGDLQYPIGSADHLSDCGIRVRYEGKLAETTEIPTTERAYNTLGLFTGYGREDYSSGSNFYVCSAAYLDAGNSYLDQTIVLLTRVPQSAATIIHYIDPDVLGTKSNDFGYYSGANKMVAQYEGNACIGLVSDLDGAESQHYAVDYVEEVQHQMETALLDQTPQNNVTDMAAAVSWNPTTLSVTPKKIYSRLIAATDTSAASGMTTIMTQDQYRRVHVPDTARIVMKSISFTQKLNKVAKDTLSLKGTVDLSQYPAEMTNLYNTDVSLFIADFLVVKPADAPFKDKLYMQKFKLEDGFFGKRILSLSFDKNKKILTFQLTVTKANIQGMTYLNASSSAGGIVYLPFALVLTGSSATDPAKGGKSWIIANSFPVNFTKTSNTIKGKM